LLLWASYYNNLETVEFLLDQPGIDTSSRFECGTMVMDRRCETTAMEIANFQGNKEIVNLFIIKDQENLFLNSEENPPNIGFEISVKLFDEPPLPFKDAVFFAYDNKLNEDLVDFSIKSGTRAFNSIQPSTLSLDEFMAVYFYTLQWSNEIQLYKCLNKALIDKTRIVTPKWKYFLYYLFAALQKIPKVTDQNILYRAVNLNVLKKYPAKYKTGQNITWYTFTSTTINSPCCGFYSEGKPHTIFTIMGSFSGRSITEMSAYPKEGEILLPPGTTFIIDSITEVGLSVNIKLTQIESENLLKLE